MVLLAVEGGSRPGNVLRIVGQVFNRPFVTQRVVVVVVRQVNGTISRRYTHRNGIMVIGSTAQRNGVVAEFNFLPFAMGQFATGNAYAASIVPIGHILVSFVGGDGILLKGGEIGPFDRRGSRWCDDTQRHFRKSNEGIRVDG